MYKIRDKLTGRIIAQVEHRSDAETLIKSVGTRYCLPELYQPPVTFDGTPKANAASAASVFGPVGRRLGHKQETQHEEA